jgi:hypothetical protein
LEVWQRGKWFVNGEKQEGYSRLPPPTCSVSAGGDCRRSPDQGKLAGIDRDVERKHWDYHEILHHSRGMESVLLGMDRSEFLN